MSRYEGKKHVAVTTLVGRFNYGNRLQNYATMRILEQGGLDAETIEFSDISPVDTCKNVAKRLLGKSIHTNETLMSPERRAAFEEFQSLIPTRRVSLRDRDFVGCYDAFVVGSDQVWNPSYMAYGRPELLEFAPSGKRVAVAASIGVREVDGRFGRRLAKALRNYVGVSVRERSAADIVERFIGQRPPVLADPTLVISSSEWHRLAAYRLIPEEPYVLAYCLGDGEARVAEACECMSGVCGATSLVRISDRDKGEELPVGPRDFIGLVENAAAVVTDSFHGSIFSMIFGRPFCVLRREGPLDIFSRLETLLDEFGQSYRLVDAEHDWERYGERPEGESLNRKLDVSKAEFDSFLRDSLGWCGWMRDE